MNAAFGAGMLARAREACFVAQACTSCRPSSLNKPSIGQGCAIPKFRKGTNFVFRDLRSQTPAGSFDLVLCRYLAFTYFARPLQKQTLARFWRSSCRIATS
jgi:chemotaxis protein methyltransferase CheR